MLFITNNQNVMNITFKIESLSKFYHPSYGKIYKKCKIKH